MSRCTCKEAVVEKLNHRIFMLKRTIEVLESLGGTAIVVDDSRNRLDEMEGFLDYVNHMQLGEPQEQGDR